MSVADGSKHVMQGTEGSDVTEPSSHDLLADLGRLARDVGPAVRPVGAQRLLASITQSARQLFGARACSLALLTDDERELEYTTASGDGADGVTGMRLPAGQGIAGYVVMSGESVAIADLSSDPRFARAVAEDTGYVPRAMLAVPVLVADRALGVLTLLDRDADRPGAEHDLALLSVFAEQTALTLQTDRAFRDLGRVLLRALASAVEDGSALADAVERAAASVPLPDPDLAELASVFARLEQQGTAERRLAVRIVREVADYTGRRSPRPAR